MPFTRVHIDESKLRHVIFNAPGLDPLLKKKADQLISRAKRIYIQIEVKGNEWRTSETTPPKYLQSFKALRLARGKWVVKVTDPGAIWVEYGAHAGGITPVLGYKPLTKALGSMYE